MNFQLSGITVYKIEIDLDELIEWCKDEDMPLDAMARTKFVALKVKERRESNQNN